MFQIGNSERLAPSRGHFAISVYSYSTCHRDDDDDTKTSFTNLLTYLEEIRSGSKVLVLVVLPPPPPHFFRLLSPEAAIFCLVARFEEVIEITRRRHSSETIRTDKRMSLFQNRDSFLAHEDSLRCVSRLGWSADFFFIFASSVPEKHLRRGWRNLGKR